MKSVFLWITFSPMIDIPRFDWMYPAVNSYRHGKTIVFLQWSAILLFFFCTYFFLSNQRVEHDMHIFYGASPRLLLVSSPTTSNNHSTRSRNKEETEDTLNEAGKRVVRVGRSREGDLPHTDRQNATWQLKKCGGYLPASGFVIV